jgi:hypothetical protein
VALTVGASLARQQSQSRLGVWLQSATRWWLVPSLLAHAATRGGRWFTLFAAAHAVAVAARMALAQLAKAEPPVEGKLRVLLVGDSFAPKIDGVATRTGWAARILPSRGHSLHILTSARAAPLEGVPVTPLPGVHPAVYRQHRLTLPGAAMATALLAFRPHVVHLYDENVVCCFMQVLCTLAGVPTVWSHHTRIDLIAARYAPAIAVLGFHRWLLTLLQRCIGGLADAHLVVGEDMAEQLAVAGCEDVR